MTAQSIFFGEDGLIRSGWRFTAFVLLFIPSWTLFALIGMGALNAVSPGPPDRRTVMFVNGMISLAVAIAAGWLCGRNLERIPFAALGTSLHDRWVRNLGFGLLLGAVTIAFGTALGLGGGGLRFSINSAAAGDIALTLFISFIVFAAPAAFEEALFRGYILQTFVRSELQVLGVLLTSVLFATVHIGNPAASGLAWLNTFIAGIWFGTAYLKSRDLWLPFGLHLAWNWTQGSIFGVEVSGLAEIVKAPLLRESDAGPVWLTGGDYGIEGGVITTVALILSIFATKNFPIDPAAHTTAREDVSVR